MDLVNFLSSVNKLSILAFLVTLGILFYEIQLLKKEKRLSSKPRIPKFEESINPQISQAATLITEKKEVVTKPNNFIIIFLIILLIIFGLATFFGFYKFNQKQNTLSETNVTPIVNLVSSKGIRLFNEQFNLLNDTQLKAIKPGDKLIIGLETINDADIDQARIRVNSNAWQLSDFTKKFSSKYQVYYINYSVASGESKLKIEAQLHSVGDGWLGD